MALEVCFVKRLDKLRILTRLIGSSFAVLPMLVFTLCLKKWRASGISENMGIPNERKATIDEGRSASMARASGN